MPPSSTPSQAVTSEVDFNLTPSSVDEAVVDASLEDTSGDLDTGMDTIMEEFETEVTERQTLIRSEIHKLAQELYVEGDYGYCRGDMQARLRKFVETNNVESNEIAREILAIKDDLVLKSYDVLYWFETFAYSDLREELQDEIGKLKSKAMDEFAEDGYSEDFYHQRRFLNQQRSIAEIMQSK